MSEFDSTPIDPYRNQLNKYPPCSRLEKDDYELYAYYRDLSKEQNAGDYIGMVCYFEDWMRYYYMMDLIDKGVRLIPLVTSGSLEDSSDQDKVYILGLANEILSKVYDDRDYSVYTEEMVDRIFKGLDSYLEELKRKWEKEDEERDRALGIR
jgi:hypothetical protein